jgi:O-antigen/teichoic acid export membrane protein
MIQVINPALGFYPLTFLLFVFSNILMAVYFKYSYICSFANKTSLILMASLVLAFLTVIFNFILIPTHGIDGASWSKLSALILTILILNFNFFNPFKIYINKK